MFKKSIFAIAAMMLAGAGVAAEGLDQTRPGRLSAVTAAAQQKDFTRLLDSAKALNQALKRVSEQNRVDKSGAVRQADQEIRAAESAAADGRMLDARLLLDEAYQTTRSALVEVMHSPVVLGRSGAQPALPADWSNVWLRSEFRARMDSTQSLREAMKRIADEKSDGPGQAELAVIDRLLQQAETLADKNDVRQGRAVADHAYLRAKLQIERMRGGETLVQTLNFASKEDEYRYELDRNETFRMLVNLLVPTEFAADSHMKSHLERAASLRNDADAMARSQQFDDAVKTMEAASEEYQEAFRAVGVAIPG
jgi:hypothetical protein